MSKIYDNSSESKFEDGLHQILTNPNVERADFCTGYFNLRGWRLVADDVEKLPGAEVFEPVTSATGLTKNVPVHRVCRLLVGMQRPAADLISEMYGLGDPLVDAKQVQRWRRQVAADFRRQLTLGVPTVEDEKGLQILKKQLESGKVCVKLHLRFPLHAKLYLVHRPDNSAPIVSVMGSSNLTFAGLSKNGELNAEFGDFHDNEKLAVWFNERWNDKYSIDITEDLIAVLDACWASPNGPTPYEVYLKIMYHLSREARQGVSEYHLPAPFDKELFDFQKTAVQLAVRHIEKSGGAMIGDVVGLGKTITACAVAKFYEEAFGASTLVLCPPNLKSMWEGYAKHYNLKMEVESIAGHFKPESMRYYRLVIIDESHNLRNGTGSRYATIKNLLSYQSNKVLLLTATPYNKDFSDLANQLKLFVDADLDLGIRPERQIEKDGGEHQFAIKHSGTALSTIGAFEKSEQTDDWRDLMKLFLVRRTRTFIRHNYAKHDPEKNRDYLELHDGVRRYFPERLPKTLTFKTAPGDMFERLYSEKSVEAMADLSLPRYGLKKYVDDEAAKSATSAEKQLLENLSRAGKRLMGYCRSGFFKRMDSSGLAFLQTVYRHIVRNAAYLYAIKNELNLPLGAGAEIGECYDEAEDANGEILFAFSTDTNHYAAKGEEAYKQILDAFPPSKTASEVKWISSKFFKKSLAAALKKDNKTLLGILADCCEWKPEQDEKLNALFDLVAKAHKDEKVLVFTQYADTAHYLAAQLAKRGVTRVAYVDGSTEDVVVKVQNFSPNSNGVKGIPLDKQTRVLVATDTLSEGQNLQDARIVVNYDLPWAIIRLIQRAGRVDRIGQTAADVFCYSFFPQEGIDKAIHLRKKLSDRIKENAETVGSDEVFFEGNAQNLKAVFTEKAGSLDDADDGEVDLASQAYQVWEAATKNNAKLRDRICNLADVVYSTKPRDLEKDPVGVITYARTRADADILVWLDADGKVVSKSPTRIFKALACTPETHALPPLANHHKLVGCALKSVLDAANSGSAGALGSKTSTKYRLFIHIQNRLKEGKYPLLEADLKAVSDLVYNYPLTEGSKIVFGKIFHPGASHYFSVDKVIDVALDRFHNGILCNVPKDAAEAPSGASARIICSLGLSKE